MDSQTIKKELNQKYKIFIIIMGIRVGLRAPRLI